MEPFSKLQVTDSISRNLGGSVVEFMGKGVSGLSEMKMETLERLLSTRPALGCFRGPAEDCVV